MRRPYFPHLPLSSNKSLEFGFHAQPSANHCDHRQEGQNMLIGQIWVMWVGRSGTIYLTFEDIEVPLREVGVMWGGQNKDHKTVIYCECYCKLWVGKGGKAFWGRWCLTKSGMIE